jgi:hypothetical protein
MNIFIEEHIQLLKDMLSEGIQFILVGGYAVNFHGYNRTTGDLDVWLKPDEDTKTKVLLLFKKYGFDKESIDHIRRLDFTQTLVFSIGDQPFKTDFLTQVSGVTYEEADIGKDFFDLEGFKIPFISFNHLILTKISTGRGKDKVDVEMLQDVKKYNKKG